MTTIRDIAKAAGVAIGTVSRALNNEIGVSEETRSRIVQLAKELNYERSPSARRPSNPSDPRCIGIVYQGHGLFYSHLVNEFEMQASRLDYTVIVSVAPPDVALQRMQRLSVRHVVFLDLSGWKPTHPFLHAQAEFEGNLLTIGSNLLDGVDHIAFDRKDAIHKAVKHLAELGHRRVGYVGKKDDKLLGFTLGLLDFKMEHDPDAILLTKRGSPFPEQQLCSLIQQDGGKKPTAFVVDGIVTLLRFASFAKRHGLRFPEDYSLITYDNIPELDEILEVPLSRVGPNIQELTRLSLDLLLASKEKEGEQQERESLEPELIVKASTAKLSL